MLTRDFALDYADPVVWRNRNDTHDREFIDGCRQDDRVEKDVGQLWHQQVDVLVLEGRESYRERVSQTMILGMFSQTMAIIAAFAYLG